jgi:hypothetical protein
MLHSPSTRRGLTHSSGPDLERQVLIGGPRLNIDEVCMMQAGCSDATHVGHVGLSTLLVRSMSSTIHCRLVRLLMARTMRCCNLKKKDLPCVVNNHNCSNMVSVSTTIMQHITAWWWAKLSASMGLRGAVTHSLFPSHYRPRFICSYEETTSGMVVLIRRWHICHSIITQSDRRLQRWNVSSVSPMG